MIDTLKYMASFIFKYLKVFVFTILFSFIPITVIVILSVFYEVFIPEYSEALIVITIIVVFYLAWKYIPGRYT
ncbi:hypothetical protein FHU10_1378 [Serratia fonticola]|uniref:Uncharacterized protein n=1 Tax=Serratia fonticola TaxID=47917 RepID=A0A542D8J6_SERFO|nr:hypothetical protein FHU09_1072 [Serratia fonticola]TQI99391.1 hypothetical protein FHU11_4979 [Serratia fonticola]TVZ68916.1 hypothetical protein FHU10_1378 [Serratia fonticola]